MMFLLNYNSQFCDTFLASWRPRDCHHHFPFEQPERDEFLPPLRLQEGQQVLRFGAQQLHEDEPLVLVVPDDHGDFRRWQVTRILWVKIRLNFGLKTTLRCLLKNMCACVLHFLNRPSILIVQTANCTIMASRGIHRSFFVRSSQLPPKAPAQKLVQKLALKQDWSHWTATSVKISSLHHVQGIGGKERLAGVQTVHHRLEEEGIRFEDDLVEIIVQETFGVFNLPHWSGGGLLCS